MKLLQLMAGAPVGGAEGFFDRLAVGLASQGADQAFVVRPQPQREALLRETGSTVETASFGGLFDFITGRKIRHTIDRVKPDIVLSWMNRATAYCPERRSGQHHVHIGTPRGYYDPKYYRRCDHLIVTTDDLKKFYKDTGWNGDKLSVIPNFVPVDHKSAIDRAKFDTPDDACLLLALGRLHENKGFDVLISAMVELPEHYLWIGGDGPLAQPLQKQVDSLGLSERVRFLGWQSDTAPLFAAADIFICSSRHEPFGNIVIESWMQKTPIVAAHSEGPGVLLEDGTDGLLVPLEDAKAMAAAISELSGGLEQAGALTAAGWQKYERDYSEAAIVPRYNALFERLAG